MMYFGNPDVDARLLGDKKATPVGRPCDNCGEAFTAGESGMFAGEQREKAFHTECFVQVVYGVELGYRPPEGLSRRKEAQCAYDFWKRQLEANAAKRIA